MMVQARAMDALFLAVGIRFEAAYPMVIGDGVAQAVKPLSSHPTTINLLGKSAQRGQLLRMRAMEYSRSAVQASTTGHSYVIRPDGSILEQTDTEQAATLTADIPLRSSLTLTAQAWGEDSTCRHGCNAHHQLLLAPRTSYRAGE